MPIVYYENWEKMKMNKEIIKKTDLYLLMLLSICLVLFLFFILYWEQFKPDIPIRELIEQRAVVATGVNFDTKVLVVLDPRTGKEIPPCDQVWGSKPGYQSVKENKLARTIDMKKDKQKCRTMIITDSNSNLISALELSRKPIAGKIKNVKKNGKEEVIDAQYVVTVQALFNGSDCTTIPGPDQIEHCNEKHR